MQQISKLLFALFNVFLLSACQQNQTSRNFSQSNQLSQTSTRESVCENVYAATLMAPTRTGSFGEGLLSATQAKSQCLAGQTISTPQAAQAPQPEQGLHTYNINGKLITCNTFGTNTICN